MEIKKNPKADLTQYRSLIFSFSLILTMSFMIMAFEWKSYDKGIAEIQGKAVNSFELLNEAPSTEIPPPPPPVIVQAVFVEVPNEEEIMEEVKITIDIEMNEDTRVEKIMVQPTLTAMEEEEEDAIFTFVEKPAEPEGGLQAFYNDIAERIKYPVQARRMKVEGKVFVEFVVNKDGSLTDIRVVKGIGAGCDEEAIKVLETAPRWKPGKQRGIPVRQRMILPIVFKMAEL